LEDVLPPEVIEIRNRIQAWWNKYLDILPSIGNQNIGSFSVGDFLNWLNGILAKLGQLKNSKLGKYLYQLLSKSSLQKPSEFSNSSGLDVDNYPNGQTTSDLCAMFSACIICPEKANKDEIDTTRDLGRMYEITKGDVYVNKTDFPRHCFTKVASAEFHPLGKNVRVYIPTFATDWVVIKDQSPESIYFLVTSLWAYTVNGDTHTADDTIPVGNGDIIKGSADGQEFVFVPIKVSQSPVEISTIANESVLTTRRTDALMLIEQLILPSLSSLDMIESPADSLARYNFLRTSHGMTNVLSYPTGGFANILIDYLCEPGVITSALGFKKLCGHVIELLRLYNNINSINNTQGYYYYNLYN
jgi:hypothetical protein